jgi:aminoglycoside 3-N-acetyltransferase
MNLKDRLKGTLRELERDYRRLVNSFDDAALAAALRQVGVAPGDLLMVHSALDAFTGYSGKPTDLIALLQAAVGPKGTLAMPTLSFSGTAVEHAASGAVFDVRRTPSRVGLLTELFRRSPSVVRSLHPTHSVAAWGAGARELVAGHEAEDTPCGPGSPYGRMLERRGKSLFLGVGVDCMTFFHAIEARLEPLMPFSPFTAEHFELACRDAEGALHTVRTRLFDPAVSRRRNLAELKSELRAAGAWHEARAGRVDVLAVGAADALAAATRLADRGEFCYERSNAPARR